MKYSGIADEAGKSIEVQIRAHKELGWNDIELRNVDGVNLTDVSDEKFEDVYARVTEAGLNVSCFASQLCNWSRPITTDFQVDIDELRRAVPRMQKFNTRYIRIMSYPNAPENPWPDAAWRDEVVRRLRELAKMAEDGGVVLAHENCSGWGGLSKENTLYLVEKIDSPAFKLIFDTGNPVGDGLDAWEFYDAVKEHVVHVHIKDAVREGDEHRHTFPGEGMGCVREIVADLKARNFGGALSIEPHIASVVHLGKEAEDEKAAYEAYITYGRKLMRIAEEV